MARRQLRAAKISDSAIGRLVARGKLVRECAGVYGVGHVAPTPLGPETVALLACPEGTLLSHLSAAELWGLVHPGSARGIVDVTIAGRQTGRPPGVRVHRTRGFHPRDVRIHQGLPVTSPARTLVDLGDLWSGRPLERAMEEGLASNIVRISQIRDAIARSPGRNGAAHLMALLDTRTGSTLSRSQGEERMLFLIRAAELPPAEMNVRLGRYTADFVWWGHRLIVEVDSYDYHSGRWAFERDRRKDAALKAAGWEVIRVTTDQLRDEPYAVIARIAQALARAEARRAS